MNPKRPRRINAYLLFGLLLVLVPGTPPSSSTGSATAAPLAPGAAPSAPAETAAATAAAETAAAPADTAAAPGSCFLPFLGDSSLADAVLDSTELHLGGMTVARPVLGEKGAWAVDYAWMTLGERPGMIFNMAQMESLAALGVVSGDTRVTLVVWRTKLHALNKEFLRGIIDLYRPKSPPAEMVAAVRAAAGLPAGE